MKLTRRGTIIELLSRGKSDPEILFELKEKFRNKNFKTSHKRALSGIKWDLRSELRNNNQKPMPNSETLKAIKDVENSSGVRVKDSNELFTQLGI